MPVNDLLHAIGIECERRHAATCQPAIVVPHSIIDLERMNPREIKVDEERRLRATSDGRTFCSELGFNTIEKSAPEPMEFAFSKDRTFLNTSLVSPQGNGRIAVCPELVVSCSFRVPIGTPPWHCRGVDVNE